MFLFKAKGNIFYGWWVVLACSLLALYGTGTVFYGFSAFVNPIVTELGWSMALISGAFSLYRLEAGIAAPLGGFILDRLGPRKLVISGIILIGAGFLYLSQVKTVLPFYSAFIIISLGFTFASGSAMVAPLIGKWFVKKRGRALGIYSALIGLGGLLVPVLSHLIALYGWRLVLFIMGPFTWLVLLPLSLTLKHKPEEYGLLPDGEPSVRVQDTLGKPIVSAIEANYSVRDAMLTSAFWIITICFFVFQMTMATVFIHLIPQLVNMGIDTQIAASVVSITTLISIAGRLGFGWLGDLYNKKWLLIIVFILQPIGVFALANARQVMHIIPFVLAYAPSYGGATVLRPAIVAEYYGRRNLGTIYGVIQGISAFGGLVGPVIAGLIYDNQGSFYLAFTIFASVNVFLALLLLFLRCPDLKNTNFEQSS